MIRYLKNLVLRNWPLKLLSFFMAMIVWLVLIPEEKIYSEKTLTIPLETRNIPQDMDLMEKPQPTIDITVRASNRILNLVTTSTVRARLDLERASVYQREYPLDKSMIILPQGAEVIRINPNQVNLKLEKTEEITLEVVPLIIGKPADGFRLAKVASVPSHVLVRGPESKLGSKDKVATSPVDVTGISQSSEFEVDLILPRAELRLASSPARARISVQVEKADNGGKNARNGKN